MSTEILISAWDYAEEMQAGDNFYIDIDLLDYINEISTEDLLDELKERNDLPKQWSFIKNSDFMSRTPKRDAITDFLNLSDMATLEEIIDAITEIYKNNK